MHFASCYFIIKNRYLYEDNYNGGPTTAYQLPIAGKIIANNLPVFEYLAHS